MLPKLDTSALRMYAMPQLIDKHGPFSFALTQTSKYQAVCWLRVGRNKKPETLQEVRKR